MLQYLNENKAIENLECKNRKDMKPYFTAEKD